MKSFRFLFIKAGIVFLVLSCSSSRTGDVMVRTAEDLPERFETPTGTSWGGNSCRNPIVDPVDGTELVLIQSQAGLGDYSVEDGKYGVGRGELLRINCTTGEVVGIIKR